MKCYDRLISISKIGLLISQVKFLISKIALSVDKTWTSPFDPLLDPFNPGGGDYPIKMTGVFVGNFVEAQNNFHP